MKRAFATTLVLALTGCAVGNPNISGEWDCQAQRGLACATLSEADAHTHSQARHVSPSPALALPSNPANEDPAEDTVLATERVRSTEVVGKVWFYPFVDGGGHYHEGGFVHVVMRPANWRVAPEHRFPKTMNKTGKQPALPIEPEPEVDTP